MKAKKHFTFLLAILALFCMCLFALTACDSCGDEGTENPTETKKLTSITLDEKPTKLVYEIGESVDTSGMKVTAKYSDETTEDVTSKCTTSLDGMKIKAETTSYYVKYTYEKVTKTARVDITVNKEDITLSDFKSDADFKEPYEIAATSTADMVFVTSVDSGTMQIDGVLELTGTAASGEFKYTERNDYNGEITELDGTPKTDDEGAPLSKKIAVMTGTYTVSDGDMALKTKTVTRLRTARLDSATVQSAEVVTNDAGEITGINFGSMVKDGKSNLFFGWGKADAGAFTESNSQNYGLEPYICYFSRVTEGAVPSDMRVYHAPVVSIEIAQAPVKAEYAPGEAFSSIGLQLRVNFAAGKSIVVTSGYSVDKDVLTVDDTTVTVSYHGYYTEAKTCTLDITVQSAYEEGLYAIDLINKITDFSYTYGEYHNLLDVLKASGMKVMAKYIEAGTPDKEVTDYAAVGYDENGVAIEGNKITPDLKYYEVSYTEDERTVKTSVNVDKITLRTPYNVAEASDADYVFYASYKLSGRTNNIDHDAVITMYEGETENAGTFLAQMYVTDKKGICINGTYTIDGDSVAFTSSGLVQLGSSETTMYSAVDETAEFVKNEDGEIIGLDFGAMNGFFGLSYEKTVTDNSAESIGKPASNACLVLIKDHNMGELNTHYGNKVVLPEAMRFTVNGADIEGDKVEIVLGETLNLLAAFTPGNTTEQRVTWDLEGNDNGIVSFEYKDGYGVFTALKVGEITVKATSVKDPTLSVTCTVKVLPIAVTGVTLDETELNLTPDAQPVTLTATVSPENATDKSVVWSSSAEGVATVDQNGVVTIVGEGTATITVKTVDGEYTAECAVTVAAIKVTGVELDEETLSILLGDEAKTLTATVAPADATNKQVSWSSSNEAVATVENGVVTAVAAGTAVITVKTVDGEFTAECTVNVVTDAISVTGVSLNETILSLAPNVQATLKATVAPADATNKNVTWKSSDEGVATVANGVVTAVGEGTATITVKTADGEFTAECAVTVAAIKVTGVTLDEKATIEKGATKTLTATVAPADATDKSVTWSSDNEEVATVDENGVVTAVAAGTANITAKTTDGEFEATCEVTVKISVTGVTLTVDKDKLENILTEQDEQYNDYFVLGKGYTENLTAHVAIAPADATTKNVTWSSSNEEIATVDENGIVTAVAVGTATITVKTEDGEFEATCEITVKSGLKNLYLKNKAYDFKLTPYEMLYKTLDDVLAEKGLVVYAQYYDNVEDKDVTSSVAYEARDDKDAIIESKLFSGNYYKNSKDNDIAHNLYSYLITYTEGEGESAVTKSYRMGNKAQWGDGDVTVSVINPYEVAATSTADLATYAWYHRQSNKADASIELFYNEIESEKKIENGGDFVFYIRLSNTTKVVVIGGTFTVSEKTITFNTSATDRYNHEDSGFVNKEAMTETATIVYSKDETTITMLDFGLMSSTNGFFEEGNSNWSASKCQTEDTYPQGSIGETIGNNKAHHIYTVVLKGYEGTVKSNYSTDLTLHIPPAAEPEKLGTPVVTVDEAGLASWEAVENASKYTVKIGDTETEQEGLSVQLTDGQNVQVKAVGDGENYSTGDYSEVQTYTHSGEQTEPENPGEGGDENGDNTDGNEE